MKVIDSSRPSLQSCLMVSLKQNDWLMIPYPIAHAKEAGMPVPKDPILFIKPRTSLAGPGELAVSKAAQDDQLDFETELALVMGEDALDVTEEEALDYVLG